MTVGEGYKYSGDSPPIDGPVSAAPVVAMAKRRPGRPPKYANDDERRAADAQRKRNARSITREKRERERELAHQRDLDQLMQAKGVIHQTIRRGKIERVLKPTATERKLTNRILAQLGLGVNTGLFLGDAPQGAGLLVYSGSEVRKVGGEQIELADGRRAPLNNGHRVKPRGFGAKYHEDGDARKQAGEGEYEFLDRHFQDATDLECHVAGCDRHVWGVRTVNGREVFCCDLHAPIH